MKTKLISFFALSLSFLFILQSCSDSGSASDVNISAHNTSKSHNMGKNCMGCHKSGGPGYGWFNAAGTVYDNSGSANYPNATVKLYTGPNGTGTLKATIEGDNFGNFYTTEIIDFSGGLYAAVEGANSTQYMPAALSMGQCNSCHGVSTDRIWTR
jgi:hypothetical protein